MVPTITAMAILALDPSYIACVPDGQPVAAATPMVIDIRNGRAVLREEDTGRAYNRKVRAYGYSVTVLDDETIWMIDAGRLRFHRVVGPRATAVADSGQCWLLDRRPARM